MKHIRVRIDAGEHTHFSPEAGANLDGQETIFVDEKGVRHFAKIVCPIHASDHAITITLELPDDAAIDSMKPPLTGISIAGHPFDQIKRYIRD